MALSAHRDARKIRIEIFLRQRGDASKQPYRLLEAQRAAIEAEMKTPLLWEELPSKQGSRISLSLEDVDLDNKRDHPRQFKWFTDRLHDFRRVFRERIRALPLEDVEDDDGEDAE